MSLFPISEFYSSTYSSFVYIVRKDEGKIGVRAAVVNQKLINQELTT